MTAFPVNGCLTQCVYVSVSISIKLFLLIYEGMSLFLLFFVPVKTNLKTSYWPLLISVSCRPKLELTPHGCMLTDQVGGYIHVSPDSYNVCVQDFGVIQ